MISNGSPFTVTTMILGLILASTTVVAWTLFERDGGEDDRRHRSHSRCDSLPQYPQNECNEAPSEDNNDSNCYYTGTLNYYQLAVQRCNDSAPYTLHGMWPTFTDGSWPQFCTPDPLDLGSFDPDLLSEMWQWWPSCPSHPDRECTKYELNKSFWEHEWARHGTCSLYSSQESFFQAAVDIVKNPQNQAKFQSGCSNVPPHKSCLKFTIQNDNNDQDDGNDNDNQ